MAAWLALCPETGRPRASMPVFAGLLGATRTREGGRP
jgi:hypothetical protein